MPELRELDVVIPAYQHQAGMERAVASLLAQTPPAGWRVRITVVDDGSRPPLVVPGDRALPDGFLVDLLRLESNRGRACARNAGAQAGNGEILLFLDCDCQYGDPSMLARQLHCHEQGFDVVGGQIGSGGTDFWARYQNEVAAARLRRFAGGECSSMTTACLSVRRVYHEAIGGFDGHFLHYGFEDRDYLLRLVARGARFAAPAHLRLRHEAPDSLRDIARKMLQAGRHTSGLMRAKHPAWYRNSMYGATDVAEHSWLRIPAWFSAALLIPLLPVGEWAVRRHRAPYWLKKVFVKGVSGLAFLRGTRERGAR